MPYMIYQQYTTAIRQAYADDSDLEGLLKSAKTYREWLQSLRIDPRLRDPLVEPIETIENAFRNLIAGGEK